MQGRIQTGSYTNKDGQTVYTTDVFANNVEFLEYGQNNDDNQNRRGNAGQGQAEEELPPGFQAVSEDDVPF